MKSSKCIITLFCSIFCFFLNAQINDGCLTRIKVQKDGFYGYLDDEGREVIPCIYDHLLDFHEGLVAGRKDGNWVYLNTGGEIVIDLQKRYTICGDFRNGKAYVTTGKMLLSQHVKGHAYTNSNDIRYINRQGEEILHLDQSELGYYVEYPSTAYFSDGLLKLPRPYLANSANTLHGYVDTTGQWVIPPRFHTQYSFEENFSEGLAVVALHPYSQMKQEPPQRYGYINKEGRWVIMPDYHHLTSFKNGVAIATIYSKYARDSYIWEIFYIDKKGKRIFPDSVQTDHQFHRNTLGVFYETDDHKYHYALADTLGSVLTPFDIDYLIPGDLWGFKRDSLIGFMNDMGETVIEPQYKNVGGFKQGLCIVTTYLNEGKFVSGVINLQNEWVMPLQDVYQYKIENGLILQFTRETIHTPSYFNRKGIEIQLSDYKFDNDDIQWVKK